MAYRLRVRNAAQLVTICSGGQRFKVGKDQDEVKHFPQSQWNKISCDSCWQASPLNLILF
jgi:hypothetical protein